ncbi:hypothetical protein [Haliangium ochraceum]|uniref:Uncharacterized protein n=1 Tax=Haliangium ochraceum (strain DSM 14365 / JCM 11303 / SMP-2) TaxID=502025 RepID=D0LS69_HALO1|nr:hypothetical protein [Haliangium ochraceum]ACY13766.1 hypothetical protein Hoch_1199 [Haliangium ochraceum DSM 14365]
MRASGPQLLQATLGAIARLEAAEVLKPRLTEPDFAKWKRFRRKLGWRDFIRLLHEDQALAFPEPFDLARWRFDPFDTLDEPTAKILVENSATPAPGDALSVLRDQARALGVAAGGAIADVPKIQSRHKALELPGSGGRIAAYQCVQHGLAYDRNFTFVTDNPAERVLIGLGAVELRSNPPTILSLAEFEAMRAAKKLRFDRVVGIKGAPGAEALAAHFDDARLV